MIQMILSFPLLADALDPHPTLAEPAAWPGVVVIAILGFFATAALLGPIVRATMRS